MTLFLSSLKKNSKIFIRSIRISKDDLSLLQKHRSGLEKEEIINKNYDPIYVKTFHGYVLRKLPRLRKKSDKYFVRRPRWLYRIKKRSPGFYHTSSFLSRRSYRYKASARAAGGLIRRRYRVYLKKNKTVVGWRRWFFKNLKKFGPWEKKRYKKYQKMDKYLGVWIRRHPNMVQFKKGIRQHRYYRFSKRFKRRFKAVAHMRFSKRFRFIRSTRSFRFISKLRRKRRLFYRQRKVAVRAYALRKLYRVFSLRRKSLARAKSTIRLWRFRLRRLRYIHRKKKKRGKRKFYRQVKQLTKKIFRSRATQTARVFALKRNALTMFKHLLNYKPEVRFGAKFRFQTLLKSVFNIQKLKRHVRSKKLKQIQRLRVSTKDKKRVQFFSYKLKSRTRSRIAYKGYRKKRQRRFLIRKRIGRIGSTRHYQHSLSTKLRRSKLHRKRLAYVSFIKMIKRKNIKRYLHIRKQTFYNFFMLIEERSVIADNYVRLRISRAFRRYARLSNYFLRSYKAYRSQRLAIARRRKMFRRVLQRRKYKRLRSTLRILRRKRKSRKLIIEKNRQVRSLSKLVRKLLLLAKKKQKVIRDVKATESLLLLNRAVTPYAKSKKQNLFLQQLLYAINRKRKLKSLFRKQPRFLFKLQGVKTFVKQPSLRNLLAFINLVGESFDVEENIAQTRALYAHRKQRTLKKMLILKKKVILPYSVRCLLYPSKKALRLKNFSLIKRRSKWNKASFREQFFGHRRNINQLYLKRVRARIQFEKEIPDFYSIKKKSIVIAKQTALESLKARRLRSVFIKRFIKAFKRRLSLRREKCLRRVRRKRVVKRIKKRKLRNRSRMTKRQLKRLKRFNRFRRRFQRKRRYLNRFIRRKLRRKLRYFKKLARHVPKNRKKLYKFIKSYYDSRRHKITLKKYSHSGTVQQLHKFHKKRLFRFSQYMRFLKQGFTFKRGFEYNTLRKFYEFKNSTLAGKKRNSLFKHVRTYKRLLLIKRRKVHFYKAWWGIKQRRYMHRRRFLSSKPKLRNKRFISHLPAVHITQTNSNYFVYVIVNKQVIFVKSTGHCGFEGSKRKAPYAVEKLGVDVGNWLLSKNMFYVTLRPHFPKLFYVARLVVKGMLKPYRLRPGKKYYHLRKNQFIYRKNPIKRYVEFVLIRRLLSKAHNGLRLPTKRRL